MGSLYVGNLHPDCTEATLFQKFSSIGTLFNIHICRDVDTGQSLGYGFMNYEKKEDAEKALSSLNYDLVKGRVIRLMWATKSANKGNVRANLFIKNLHPEIDEKTMHDVFGTYGRILSLKVVTDDHGGSRGSGFVQFENEDDADEALANLNGKIIRGREIYVSKFIPKEKKSEDFNNLYIKNFDLKWVAEDLEELCEKFGTIISAKVMTNDNGESKGFGFVSFKDADSAKQAVQNLNGIFINGRKLYVGRAKKKFERRAEVLSNLRRKIQLASP